MNKEDKDRIILLKVLGGVPLPDDFLYRYHTHIYCHRGSIDFVFNDKPYTCKAGGLVFFLRTASWQI
ncbi:cupin domain-containing protein [Pontibacter flavimaris]|uniref:hypothetical protein n=1 Tax=Pontibacter flavimaris TaxID=1797110 RepID=UPI00197E8623|nr:hypothetical protein [Pontibacter flavimaris]